MNFKRLLGKTLNFFTALHPLDGNNSAKIYFLETEPQQVVSPDKKTTKYVPGGVYWGVLKSSGLLLYGPFKDMPHAKMNINDAYKNARSSLACDPRKKLVFPPASWTAYAHDPSDAT